ncbi:MAG: hypothetical protein V3U57_09970 [Robiginitomaculum sp.]
MSKKTLAMLWAFACLAQFGIGASAQTSTQQLPTQLSTDTPTENRVSFTLNTGSFSFDNVGQSFISKTHTDNLTSLTTLSHDVLAKAVEDKPGFVKYGALGLHLIASIRLQFGNAYVLHEYAHAEEGYHLGLKNTFVGKTDAKGNVARKNSYLGNLLTMSFGMAPWVVTNRRVGVTSDGNSPTVISYVESVGAGLNLNTFLAEQSFHNMLRSERPVTESISYLTNKVFPIIYFIADGKIGGDPSMYIEALSWLGPKLTKEQVQKYNLATTILSNGFISSVRSVPKYFSANQTVALLKYDTTFGGRDTSIYWPEFSTYLNGTGVSVQGEVFAKISGYGLFGLALEKNVLGKNEGMDITASFATSLGKWHPEGSLTLNTQEGVFVTLGGDYTVNDRFSVTAKMYSSGKGTLRGDRLVPQDKHGGYVGVKVNF